MSTTTAAEIIRYRKTKAGEWVAYGPASAVLPNEFVTVTKANGETKTELIARTGKPFQVDGRWMVYGYLAPRSPRSPRHSSSGAASAGSVPDCGHRHHVRGCFCCEHGIGL